RRVALRHAVRPAPSQSPPWPDLPAAGGDDRAGHARAALPLRGGPDRHLRPGVDRDRGRPARDAAPIVGVARPVFSADRGRGVIYRMVRALFRAALFAFFRRVEAQGRASVPARGPVLIVSNHTNALVDALLMLTPLDR